MIGLRTCAIVVSLLLCTGVPAFAADDDSLSALLDGVGEIAAPGIPGTLSVYGKDAFAVVVGSVARTKQAPVVAAAHMGKGRVVALGHDGYFGGDALATADTGQLVLNAIRWAGGRTAPRVAVHRQGGLLTFLTEHGVAAQALDEADWPQKLAGFNVACFHPTSLSDAQKISAVATFVREGGGIIVADTGWGWLQLHSGQTLAADHPGNRLLLPAGLAWSDGQAQRTSDLGFTAEPAISPLVHAGRALTAVVNHAGAGPQLSPEDLSQAVLVLTEAARVIPADDQALLPQLRRLEQEHATEAIPSPKAPLTLDKPLGRLALTLQLQELQSLPPEEIKAHPAASEFPGSVPDDAERVSETIEIDTTVPAWHSTGLYAPPGEVLEVDVPEAAARQGLWVQIGAHRDRLWGHAKWRRCPEICARQRLDAPRTRIASAFGGLVYIDVPGKCKLGTIAVTIRGAVRAPRFVLGKTSVADWRSQIRQYPAPWAELETSKVVLTVPSRVVRTLDDPEDLMRFWNRVLDACADLAQRPLDRERPERYVTDVQISAGYMHSGYPIMTLLDVADVIVNKERILANDHGGVWGLFHELGHNHQSGDWTFGGTGEVTVNLFTMYVFEQVIGAKEPAHPAIKPESREKKVKDYFAAGADFQRWKSDPFLALIMYIQLKEAFGWEAYKKVFAEYRSLPTDKHPKSDDEKRDQWMVRFSRTVGRNLGPFFETWGVPTSEEARASIADLPVWMPEDFPPK